MKFLTLITLLISLFSQSVLSQNTEAKNVQIKDAKVRAPIPGMDNTVGYMTLINSSSTDISLVAAKSTLSAKVEFHDHIMTAGVMKMVKLDDLTIKANETKTFETGGLHLMFIGLDHSQAMQEKVSVTFKFNDGSEKVSEFSVKSIHQHHH